jgi:hypothetical protein
MIRIFLVTISVLMINSCASFFPSVQQTTQSPWKNFYEVKKGFDQITPNVTTSNDLKKLGFNPFETPNVKLLTYLDLLEKFMPNPSITLNDIDPGVKSCLEARDHCFGYEATPSNLHSKRYGNLFLDLLNFKRKKRTSGWKFNALIVLKKNLVVHKVWGGDPKVSEFEYKKNPLGPFQDIGGILPSINIR